MKYFHTLILLMILIACKDNHVIDPLFPWPSSGIEEADSIMTALEYRMAKLDSLCSSQDNNQQLRERLCSIANIYRDNESLQLRKHFLEILAIRNWTNDKAASHRLDSIIQKINITRYPYEYHKLTTLKVEMEIDPVRQYDMIIDNLAFFEKSGSHIDKARNLILAGNVMSNLEDTLLALNYFTKASEIFKELGCNYAYGITCNNIAIISEYEKGEAILRNLLADSACCEVPARVLALQNLYVRTDSLPLLKEALEIYNNQSVDHKHLPIVMALIGRHYINNGHPDKGIEILLNAVDTANKYVPEYGKNLMIINNFLADGYYLLDNKDSCIEAFSRARHYAEIFNRQKATAGVYATDASVRIKMAERNVRLERERTVWILIISILMLGILILLLVLHIRKRRAEKMYHDMLMAERHERNLQSIRAQSKIMEESDKLVVSVAAEINILLSASKLTEDGALRLRKLLKIHNSNEDSRQGYLKVQKELDTRFMERLKQDYPNMPETQLRLASLIASGLDNRQIESILNIEYASLYKGRYRLRSRLGLTKEQSLEDFLRTYNRPLSD